MEEKNQPTETLQEIKDIRRIMERSSRFISLSGLSGIAAGTCALIGAGFGLKILKNYYGGYNSRGIFSGDDFSGLKIKLLGLAIAVFVVAFASSFYLTWRRTKEQGLPMWDHASKRLFWNMLIPLVAGAAFILAMLRYDEWRFIAPSSLIFYGLALVNASKYTVSDIRYLGYCEIILGLINMFFIGYGLYFWAAGFGILHIVYGAIMWFKYERK
ncbi:MAG TPA: hypothetical protein VK483_09455 [Chitinophagaceae bacterium]|nr:hypothetical protein [Chitinophagaceae bacterium]